MVQGPPVTPQQPSQMQEGGRKNAKRTKNENHCPGERRYEGGQWGHNPPPEPPVTLMEWGEPLGGVGAFGVSLFTGRYKQSPLSWGWGGHIPRATLPPAMAIFNPAVPGALRSFLFRGGDVPTRLAPHHTLAWGASGTSRHSPGTIPPPLPFPLWDHPMGPLARGRPSRGPGTGEGGAQAPGSPGAGGCGEPGCPVSQPGSPLPGPQAPPRMCPQRPPVPCPRCQPGCWTLTKGSRKTPATTAKVGGVQTPGCRGVAGRT